MIARALTLLGALLLGVPALAQNPPVTRYGNTLWTPGGVADVRLPIMATQTGSYNPLYTGSQLNALGTDDSVIIPFNCPSGCSSQMPRSTSAVFPPNHFTCFVNEGSSILQVGTQDTTNSPIEGAPLTSNAIQLPQYGSVCLRAKTTNHYEMVGPSVLPGGNYAWTGSNSFNGTVIGLNNAQTAAFNIDPATIPCGSTIQYNSANAANATALSTLQPGCNYAIDAIAAGLVTVVAGSGATLVTACTTARTRASHSVIWVHTESAGVVNVSGDCG